MKPIFVATGIAFVSTGIISVSTGIVFVSTETISVSTDIVFVSTEIISAGDYLDLVRALFASDAFLTCLNAHLPGPLGPPAYRAASVHIRAHPRSKDS